MMNKLYKYLPFGIKVQYANEFGSGIGKLYGIDLLDIINIDNVKQADLEDVKPILRPFEDLTKELPLTKAAAEMLGMEEGEAVSVIEKFYYILGLDVDYKNHPRNKYPIYGISYDSDTTIIILNNHYGLWINCVNPDFEELIYPEKAFDFLRAMHFAVDFREDEYIKLED